MKKGQGFTWETLITATIVILVGVIVIFIFRSYINKQTGAIDTQLASLGDCDCDGIANMFDECKCEKGSAEFKGCTKDPSQMKDDEKKCKLTSLDQCPENKFPGNKCPPIDIAK
ncbi:hypothetical protein KY330_00780 [Candidatus Woesearchaeota archaeon]|nr:hypothetical protein [Candidatus Woesearchaeota archaeon]